MLDGLFRAVTSARAQGGHSVEGSMETDTHYYQIQNPPHHTHRPRGTAVILGGAVRGSGATGDFGSAWLHNTLSLTKKVHEKQNPALGP